jgi:hypothetical protein
LPSAPAPEARRGWRTACGACHATETTVEMTGAALGSWHALLMTSALPSAIQQLALFISSLLLPFFLFHFSPLQMVRGKIRIRIELGIR